MFGQNPIRKPLKGNGNLLEVQHIFSTFQGECIFTGWPSVFIRLGGCNLMCSFCDTEFESYKVMSLQEIIIRVSTLAINDEGKRVRPLIVITGGEPFRQPIEKLCNILLEHGYKIQIETNGTLYRKIPEEIYIVCSPKNTGQGYKRIREDLLKRVDALKFIISEQNALYNHIGEVGQSDYDIPVYIQPMDEYNPRKNKKNMELVVQLASQNGYRISLQTHKIINIE